MDIEYPELSLTPSSHIYTSENSKATSFLFQTQFLSSKHENCKTVKANTALQSIFMIPWVIWYRCCRLRFSRVTKSQHSKALLAITVIGKALILRFLIWVALSFISSLTNYTSTDYLVNCSFIAHEEWGGMQASLGILDQGTSFLHPTVTTLQLSRLNLTRDVRATITDAYRRQDETAWFQTTVNVFVKRLTVCMRRPPFLLRRVEF